MTLHTAVCIMIRIKTKPVPTPMVRYMSKMVHQGVTVTFEWAIDTFNCLNIFFQIQHWIEGALLPCIPHSKESKVIFYCLSYILLG